jgi:hypothetical protein
MVNDRAPKLVGCIWQALWRRLSTRLNMSYSRHPETDRLTERILLSATFTLFLLQRWLELDTLTASS